MNIEELLNELAESIEARTDLENCYTVSNGTNNGFEKLVPEILETLKDRIKFDYNVFYGHHFPDLEIILNGKKYGIELKSRKKEQWTTNGNSVFESITEENYTAIFLMFGSLNKQETAYRVKYRPYWEVTTGIAVTHSPRFKIDMRAEQNESVFQNETEYFGLRDMNEKDRIKFLQNYLKKSTEKSKWYIPQETESVKPIQFKDLTDEIKDKVLAETFVLFPNDLIKRYPSGLFRGEYGRSTEYLLEQYFFFTPSLRDSYSAGGIYMYNDVEFPQVIAKLKTLKSTIESILTDASEDFKNIAYKTWQEVLAKEWTKDFRKDYYAVLDKIGEMYLKNELKDAELESLSYLYNLD